MGLSASTAPYRRAVTVSTVMETVCFFTWKACPVVVTSLLCMWEMKSSSCWSPIPRLKRTVQFMSRNWGMPCHMWEVGQEFYLYVVCVCIYIYSANVRPERLIRKLKSGSLQATVWVLCVYMCVCIKASRERDSYIFTVAKLIWVVISWCWPFPVWSHIHSNCSATSLESRKCMLEILRSTITLSLGIPFYLDRSLSSKNIKHLHNILKRMKQNVSIPEIFISWKLWIELKLKAQSQWLVQALLTLIFIVSSWLRSSGIYVNVLVDYFQYTCTV